MGIPVISSFTSTKLNLARQSGHLLACSTQGFRHSLCITWPHGCTHARGWTSTCKPSSSLILRLSAAIWTAPVSSELPASRSAVGESIFGSRLCMHTMQISASMLTVAKAESNHESGQKIDRDTWRASGENRRRKWVGCQAGPRCRGRTDGVNDFVG